jgi:hypothetical protein
MNTENSFYEELTEVAESRIKGLIGHAEEMEARECGFPHAGKYFRDAAFIVYLAWQDVTEGWRWHGDLERLKALTEDASWIK